MLCLERHTKKDVELAWAYDNPEANGKKLFTVFYTPRYKGTALIEHEDSRSLLEDDALMIMTEFSLSKDEYDHLVSHISHNGVSDQDWPTRLKRAYLRISAAIDEKLKKEIKFDLTEKVHFSGRRGIQPKKGPTTSQASLGAVARARRLHSHRC